MVLEPRPCLALEPAQSDSGPAAIVACRLGREMAARVLAFRDAGGLVEDVMGVTVDPRGSDCDISFPQVAGHHHLLEDRILFTPAFPFERGLRYRATFDTAPFLGPGAGGCSSLEFSLAPDERAAEPAEVTAIYPSSDHLPENILRFYVNFANAMEIGHAGREILILGPDGAPAADVLYRAPVELWDRSARTLTILLDPGRLKRGVGPNRALGPPLRAGMSYTLVIGAGMTNLSGCRLGQAVTKRFHATAAVRAPVPSHRWKVTAPRARSLDALAVDFPTPLDWAALFNTVTVVGHGGDRVRGRVSTDRFERRWLFTPDRAWAAGTYRMEVDPQLEDACGNNLDAPFDRPVATGPAAAMQALAATISFSVAS